MLQLHIINSKRKKWKDTEVLPAEDPLPPFISLLSQELRVAAAAAAKSLQSWPTLCDPIDSSPPGSTISGILQARTLECTAISFSSAWKWKWNWSHSVTSDSVQPHGLQPTRLLRPWDFPGKSTGVGCHCLLQIVAEKNINTFPTLHPEGASKDSPSMASGMPTFSTYHSFICPTLLKFSQVSIKL